MRSAVIKLLQGKGVAIGNDASNEEILSALVPITFPKTQNPAPQNPSTPPPTAVFNPKLNMADTNANFDTWSKDQCDSFYSSRLNEEMTRNGGDAIKAARVIHAMYPALFTRMEDIRRQIVGAQSAADQYPAPAPCGIPSDENIARFGMTRPSLDEFQTAFKANGSVHEPVQPGKLFDALVIKSMKDANLDASQAATRVGGQFPKLKNMVDSEKANAAVGRGYTAPKNPFAPV